MSVTVKFNQGAWMARDDEDAEDFRVTWADTPQAALINLADYYTSQCEWYAKKAERAAEVAAEARRMAKEYEQQVQM